MQNTFWLSSPADDPAVAGGVVCAEVDRLDLEEFCDVDEEGGGERGEDVEDHAAASPLNTTE